MRLSCPQAADELKRDERGIRSVEQIYYTQCPIGYGLGASNGFQVKRLSPGYPLSADVRHLGLRAYPPGTRELAPPSLRYRREGETAEVARLTPRTREYETERGLWGRPGGHFAHGLRLKPDELATLKNWPAGLSDAPFWRTSDPEPSRGQLPDPIDWNEQALPIPPQFSEVARHLDLEAEPFARLLAATSKALQESRTLFLIDDPKRLGLHLAVLTFAFPAALRPDLTFSTYHDRPEELLGFRIQGTTPNARPNRAALASLGLVADLTTGRFDPAIEPPAWANTLASWFTRRTNEDEADWNQTEGFAAQSFPNRPTKLEEAWSETYLNGLFGLAQALRDTSPPRDSEGWQTLAELASWVRRAGLGEVWAAERDPGWWLALEGIDLGRPEIGDALQAHLLVNRVWRNNATARAWGEVVARWAGVDPAARWKVVKKVLRQKKLKEPQRSGFLVGLLRLLPQAESGPFLHRLRAEELVKESTLLPLEAHAATVALLERNQTDPLLQVLGRAFEVPEAVAGVLDALAAEYEARRQTVDLPAKLIATLIEEAEPGTSSAFEQWALTRPDAENWLGPLLGRRFQTPELTEDWKISLRERTPPPLHPALARVALWVASDRSIPVEAFRWAVESLLLPLPRTERPKDSTWADLYLQRTPSPLDLCNRLIKYKDVGLRDWLVQARQAGELSKPSEAHLINSTELWKTLTRGDASELARVDLARVPEPDRGPILEKLVKHLASGSFKKLLQVLDSCRESWPGSFDPGASGLDLLATPLATSIQDYLPDTNLWMDQLGVVLEHLGRPEDFAPDSLAAEVVAASSKLGHPDNRWKLRQALLGREDAWKLLARDANEDFQSAKPEAAAQVLGRWDEAIDKATHTARFYELMLNSCDGPRLAKIVSARSRDLRTLGPLAWWNANRFPDAVNDLRDAFARLSPMVPLDEDSLIVVRNWMNPKAVSSASESVDEDLPPLEPEPTPAAEPADPSPSRLSAFGECRWRCLDALSTFHRSGQTDEGRWQNVLAWIRDRLPLAELEPDDQHRFLAWVIHDLEALESNRIAQLSAWLVKTVGLVDVDRVNRWPDDLGKEPGELRARRVMLVSDLRQELRQVLREHQERPSKRPSADSP